LSNEFDSTFNDLEPSAEPDAPETTAAPEPKPGAQTAPKPAESASAAPKIPVAKADDDDEFSAPRSGTFVELRNTANRFGKMAKAATHKAQELEAKIKELESRSSQPPPDVAKIQADYQRLVKENEEHRARLTQADYANSPDYEQKYKAPYQQAYTRGRSAVEGLKVRIVDPETEEVSFRPGTAEDFDKIYGMTDSDADEAAEKMFGASARRVVALRDTAKERAEMAYVAVKENTAKFAETRKTEEARSSSQKIALQGLWRKVNDDLQLKHAEWFGEREGDKEWNEALVKGTAIAQQRFSDQYMQLPPEQRVVLDAQIFNRTRAFTPMRALIARQTAELAELKKTIEQMRASGPGKPTPGAAGAEAPAADDLEEGKRRGIF
jgi:DNA repair exonuclease SbcCD ATPase subunit